MPADYMMCRDDMVKEGHPMKEAQRMCAIQYYKKHGKALPRDAKSGLTADEIPLDAEYNPIDDADDAIVLDYMYQALASQVKPISDVTKNDFIKYIRIK